MASPTHYLWFDFCVNSLTTRRSFGRGGAEGVPKLGVPFLSKPGTHDEALGQVREALEHGDGAGADIRRAAKHYRNSR